MTWVPRSESLQLYVAFFVPSLLSSLRIILTVVQPVSDTFEAQFRQTSDLIDLTRSTAASVSEANQNILEYGTEDEYGHLCLATTPNRCGSIYVRYSNASFFPYKHGAGPETKTQAIILPDFQKKLDRLPLQIQGSLAESTTSARLRPMVETSDLNLVKSAMSTALTDMVLLFDEYHFNSADDLSGRGRTKAPTRSSSEGQLTTYCLR